MTESLYPARVNLDPAWTGRHRRRAGRPARARARRPDEPADHH